VIYSAWIGVIVLSVELKTSVECFVTYVDYFHGDKIKLLRVYTASECGGTRWRTGGEVKGKLANGMGSQYSHTPPERDVSSITNADAHTSAASSQLNWLPRRLKWTRPFMRNTKSGFCACAIRYRTSFYCSFLTAFCM